MLYCTWIIEWPEVREGLRNDAGGGPGDNVWTVNRVSWQLCERSTVFSSLINNDVHVVIDSIDSKKNTITEAHFKMYNSEHYSPGL